MTFVGDYKPIILRQQVNGQPGFLIRPTSDSWERSLVFTDWEQLRGWVEALAGQVVTVENPAAEIQSHNDWLESNR